jgi:hypothetical protein
MRKTELQKIARKSETAPWKFGLVNYASSVLVSCFFYTISQTDLSEPGRCRL